MIPAMNVPCPAYSWIADEVTFSTSWGSAGVTPASQSVSELCVACNHRPVSTTDTRTPSPALVSPVLAGTGSETGGSSGSV